MIPDTAYETLLKSYTAEQRARKQLFNMVQELKGNVRVYCRVRPASSQGNEVSCTGSLLSCGSR